MNLEPEAETETSKHTEAKKAKWFSFRLIQNPEEKKTQTQVSEKKNSAEPDFLQLLIELLSTATITAKKEIQNKQKTIMNIVKNFNLCCLFLKSIIAIKKIINKYNNETTKEEIKKRQIGGQIINEKKTEEKDTKIQQDETYSRYKLMIQKQFPNRNDVHCSHKAAVQHVSNGVCALCNVLLFYTTRNKYRTHFGKVL